MDFKKIKKLARDFKDLHPAICGKNSPSLTEILYFVAHNLPLIGLQVDYIKTDQLETRIA